MPSHSAIIAGTGSCLPERRLTNHDLARMVETSDEWIVQRTGIRERRIVSKDESTATLASHAATRALKAAQLEPKDLDLILVGTATPEMMMPSTACFVAHSLGLDRTPAFDLNAACSGFIYGLHTGVTFIESGRYRTVLVIGAETLSRIIDYTDRSTCILFGDGAGAAVLRREERSASAGDRRGVLYTSIYADGGGWEMLQWPPGSRNPIDERMIAAGNQFVKIRGREVYKFAVTRFIEMIQDAMTRCELSADDIAMIIPHQVNQRIIDSAMEKLELPRERAVVNIDRYGNTSAASIPIALDEETRAGRLRPGDIAILVAFGAGLTWGNVVLRV